MERMLRVQTVKFVGPGFSSISPGKEKRATTSSGDQASDKWKVKKVGIGRVLLSVEMLFGMVQGEGDENERSEVTRWNGDGMTVGGGRR